MNNHKALGKLERLLAMWKNARPLIACKSTHFLFTKIHFKEKE